MAIEQSTRTQLACKVVDLRRIGPKAKRRTSFVTPRKAEEYDTKTELQKLATWSDQKKREIDMETKLSAYFREFEMLCSFTHPNIIAVDKVSITNSSLYIFQDLATAGNLHNYLSVNNNNLAEIESDSLIWQILAAIQFLHEKNIVHRNLRPENILVTGCTTGTRILLTSFGNARKIAPVRTTHIVPDDVSAYHAEATSAANMFSTDMYCIGVISALLLLGITTNDARHASTSSRLTSEVTLKQIEQQGRWKNLSKNSKEFVTDLLDSQDSNRMSAAEALRRPWFPQSQPSIDFEELYQRAVSKWRPRMSTTPLVEFVAGRSNTIRSLKCAEYIIDRETQLREASRSRNIPVEPPYKPFPRRMHEQGGFWPRKRRARNISEEAEEAIARDWSSVPTDKTDPPIRNVAAGTFGFGQPTKPTLQASTVSKASLVMPALQRSSSLELKPSLLTPANPPPEQPKNIEKADHGIYNDVAISRDREAAKRRSSEEKDLPKVRFLRPLDNIGRQSKNLGGRKVETLIAAKPVEKKAPVALNVRSRSKLPSRLRLPFRSRSLERPISALAAKTYTRSVYDHDLNVHTDAEHRTNELTPSGRSNETHDAVLKTDTIRNGSGVWVHEEWLRLTQQEMEC